MADDKITKPKRSRGKPPLFAKPGKRFMATLPLECTRDLEKLAANEARDPTMRPSKSMAIAWLWEYWKQKEGR